MLRSGILKAVVLGASALAFTPLTVRAQPSPVTQTFGKIPAEDANYPFTNNATSGGTGSATFAANINPSNTFEIGYFTDVAPATGNPAAKGTGAFGVFNNNNGSTVYTTQLDFAPKLFHKNSGPGPADAARNRLGFSLASYDLVAGSKGFDASTSVTVLLSVDGAAHASALTITGSNANKYFNFNVGSATRDSQANATLTPAVGLITLTLPSSSTLDTRIAVRIIISTSNRSQILISNVSLTTGDNSPLPVELTRFDATAKSQAVSLSWATASEKNNDRFEVQRSATGSEYATIGAVKGQGSTTMAHDYSFVDSRPLAGTSYYRLRQVDADGTFSFSPVAAVQTEARTKVLLYPNPSANLLILPAGIGAVQYRMFNALGQTLLSGKATDNDRLDITSLPKGPFFLELSGATGHHTQRLMRE